MSDQSKNSGPHQSSGDAHNDGKGDPHNYGIANKLDLTSNSDQDNSPRQKVAASTPYMPQSGKPAGDPHTEADKAGSDSDKDPREKVAATTPYMPQAGKPAGNSSL